MDPINSVERISLNKKLSDKESVRKTMFLTFFNSKI